MILKLGCAYFTSFDRFLLIKFFDVNNRTTPCVQDRERCFMKEELPYQSYYRTLSCQLCGTEKSTNKSVNKFVLWVMLKVFLWNRFSLKGEKNAI